LARIGSNGHISFILCVISGLFTWRNALRTPPSNSRQAESEQCYLMLINEAIKGLDDIAAGRTRDARQCIAELRQEFAHWAVQTRTTPTLKK
jgi:hypothetical protein